MKRLQYMHRGRSTYAIPRENFYTSVPTYAIFQVKISIRVCPPRPYSKWKFLYECAHLCHIPSEDFYTSVPT